MVTLPGKARVAELVYAIGLKPIVREGMWVRVPPRALSIAREHRAVLARPLGLVERRVGGGDEVVGGVMEVGGGDARADGHVDAADVERLDRPPDLLGNHERPG